MGRHNRIIDVLAGQNVVFGWFAPAPSAEHAKRAAADPLMDFVFINMESPRAYDPPAIHAFEQAMLEAGLHTNPNTHPIAVRIPPFHADPAAGRTRVSEVLNMGAHAVVFPGMETAEEATRAIAAMRFAKAGVPAGDARPAGFGIAPGYWGMSDQEYEMRADVWPQNRVGELASIFIIESETGLRNSRAIVDARPTIAFAGPGTLRGVMKGDMAKVEAAIQSVLASCTDANVPCGITANAADVERRIKEGFRAIIIYDRDYAETIKIARKAAGRS
jgi:2-keto-3-deoxy-L-rhamnonate aldolase RhmA